MLTCHFDDSKIDEKTNFDEVYPQSTGKKCHFSLLESRARYGIKKLRTLHLPLEEPITAFSKSGKWFGMID